MPIDDQTLIAYLDGQLDDAACARLEAELGSDPQASARLDRLARSADLARRSFGPVLEEPVPPQLIDAIWQQPDPRQQPGAGTRRPVAPARSGPGWLRTWWEQGTRWPAVAAGGALATLVAVLTLPAGPWQAGGPPERWALQTGAAVTEGGAAAGPGHGRQRESPADPSGNGEPHGQLRDQPGALPRNRPGDTGRRPERAGGGLPEPDRASGRWCSRKRDPAPAT